MQFGRASSGYPQINMVMDDGASLFWLMDTGGIRCWDATNAEMVISVK